MTAKAYSYLTDNNDEDKKTKGTKRCVIKRTLQFEDYKNFLKTIQLENKIEQLEKNKVNVDNIKENHKQLTK